MKTIRQIAKETGCSYETVFRTVKKEQLIVHYEDRGFGTKLNLTIHQEDYIHDILYWSGYFTELTIESKMNKPEPIELYSRKDFIEKGYIIEN